MRGCRGSQPSASIRAVSCIRDVVVAISFEENIEEKNSGQQHEAQQADGVQVEGSEDIGEVEAKTAQAVIQMAGGGGGGGAYCCRRHAVWERTLRQPLVIRKREYLMIIPFIFYIHHWFRPSNKVIYSSERSISLGILSFHLVGV